MVAKRIALLIVAVAGSLLGLAALAAPAGAFVYWAQGTEQAIGRANLDGTGADPGFLEPGVNTCGLAVDDTYMYWGVGDMAGGSIARAKLDGTDVDTGFISGTSNPCGIAVDDTYVYWANRGGGSIGRALLDGTSVDQSFVSGISNPCGMTVTPNAVYWTDTSAIGRASINGTNVDASFITGVNAQCGAIDANSAHVYFPSTTTSVGRANLDGSATDLSFISGIGGNFVCGVTVDDEYVYWGQFNDGSPIGRANLDGTGVNNTFIAGAGSSCDLTADGLIRPTATAVSCTPARVGSQQPSSCTATVTDTSPRDPIAPTGSVTFVSSDAAGSLPRGPSCVLTTGGPSPPGAASCSVSYAGQRSANVRADYGGREGAYAISDGQATVTVGGFTLGATTLDRKRGRATIGASTPGPGLVTLTGGGVKSVGVDLDAAGSTTLAVLPNRQLRRKLRRRGEASVEVGLTFFPLGGGQQSAASAEVELKRKVKRKQR